MQLKKISYNLRLLFLETFRSRITLLLLILLPAVFYIIAIYTTSTVPILIKIASAPGNGVFLIEPREIGLIYIGLAATGFIASFFAMNLMQKNTMAKKRQILCGYTIFELCLSKFLLILTVVMFLGIYTSLLGIILMDPKHIPGIVLGYILCGFVYGSFGLLAGAVFNRELEGILVIVLLANLDIGWLQNPIFYAAAPGKMIIKYLPGFNPSQVAIVSAFTDFTAGRQVLLSLMYGSLFLVISMIIFGIKMKMLSGSRS
ncbi:MAG: ABC transporter permease [Bacteroidales bacterium]|nr:ABC transporter permease [Bacteroidales bacterium]